MLDEMRQDDLDYATPWNINDGRCEDFAVAVVNAIEDVNLYEYANLLLDYSDLTGITTDVRCLLPSEPRPDVDEIQAVTGGHMFVEWNGRFYDAECTAGVDDPRELPLYRNMRTLCKLSTIEEKLRYSAQARAASLRRDCYTVRFRRR